MVRIALFTSIMCSINYDINKECIDTKNGEKYWQFASICLFILVSYLISSETLKKPIEGIRMFAVILDHQIRYYLFFSINVSKILGHFFCN